MLLAGPAVGGGWSAPHRLPGGGLRGRPARAVDAGPAPPRFRRRCRAGHPRRAGGAAGQSGCLPGAAASVYPERRSSPASGHNIRGRHIPSSLSARPSGWCTHLLLIAPRAPPLLRVQDEGTDRATRAPLWDRRLARQAEAGLHCLSHHDPSAGNAGEGAGGGAEAALTACAARPGGYHGAVGMAARCAWGQIRASRGAV